MSFRKLLHFAVLCIELYRHINERLNHFVQLFPQTIVGDFNKEQEKFVKEKHSKRSEAAVPPWVGYNEEETMKEQIMALSQVM